jgi:hypothetical protein
MSKWYLQIAKQTLTVVCEVFATAIVKGVRQKDYFHNQLLMKQKF